MRFQDAHKSIQKALITAAKFGFIRRETFWNYLTKPNISYKYDLWNQLMKTSYLKGYERLGVAKDYYCLSRKGHSIMSDYGFEPVEKAHPLHFEHDEIILNFTLDSENKGLIKSNWMTERTLKQLNSQAQINLTGHVLEKYPDLIFELNVDKVKLMCALEVERTRKSKSRYDSIVLSYNRHKELKLILIFYKDEYTKRSILESVKKLGYPQDKRPFIFCKISDMLNDPNSFKIDINNLKIELSQYVKNLRQIVENSTDKSPEIHSGINSVKYEAAS